MIFPGKLNIEKVAALTTFAVVGAVALFLTFPSSGDKVGYTGALQAPSMNISLVMPVQETLEACEELQANAIKEGNEFKKLNPEFVFYVSDCVKLIYKKH